ncbi:MAG: discoidin domain-containing protein [Spirochaetia bacterium]|nr:discoidin domain-containing protein [Spirochaetia bacterium]
MKKLLLILGLLSPFALYAETIPASIAIDVSATVTTFKPFNIFGNNTNGWASPVPVKDKIQAAGNYLLRYPGGSWGDAYFWNGAGSYDADGNWVVSETEYANSCIVSEHLHDAPRIIDGDDTTAWRSNTDTDYPNGQWVYFDLKGQMNPDKIVITWGNAADKAWPYAKKLTIQYWDPSNERQWMVYGAEKNGWINTSAAEIEGKPGVQTVKFAAVRTQYIRILMQISSAGRRGAYSIASVKIYEKENELEIKEKNCVVASSTNTASKLNTGWHIFGFGEFMDFCGTFTPKAQPVIIVNVGSSNPETAAAWVKYANIKKGYAIKYWEIGNENGGQWEAGGPMNVYDYTRKFIKYYEAMKAVDPSITILAQCNYPDATGVYDRVPGYKAMINRLAKEKKTKYLEGLVVHQYPIWGQPVEKVLACPKQNFADMKRMMAEQAVGHPELANVPVWITEYNTEGTVKPHAISTRLENALFITSYLCEFISHFGDRGYTNYWDVLNGGDAITNENGGDHGYMQAEEGEYQYQERATYWAMKMLTNNWSSPGDLNDHRMVEAKSDNTLLDAFANVKPDGTMSLLVINKDPAKAYNAQITIAGFKPEGTAKVWTFDSSNYKWNTETKPYHADPSRAPDENNMGVGEKFGREFKPYSITVLNMKPVK